MSSRAARRLATCAAAVLVLGAALSACGDEPGWDPTAVEGYLQESQAARFPDLEVGAADCPGHHALTDTMTVTCTLAVSDAEVPYRVRLAHARGDRVSIDVVLDSVVLRNVDIQTYVRSTLPQDFKQAQVDCGHALVVAQVGDALDCTLASGAETKPLSVEVEDAAGHLTVS